ncbi:hypothetical protein MRX96_006102 [Rhipicephalus microplus]|nr:uncharacterized protein LOC119180099 isoform X1 [Rhipicephalus microplus]
MVSTGLLVGVFCISALHAVSSLKIVGHAIRGSETMEKEKFEISPKADPHNGVQGGKTTETEKQSVVMFEVKPIDDGEGYNMDKDFKKVPTAPQNSSDAEAERSDPVDDASKAMQKALGNAVAEFLPAARK